MFSIAEKILAYIRAVPPAEFDDAAFNDLAVELFRHQTEKNAVYRGICAQQHLAPDRVTAWREIPAVTTSAFKAVALTCFPPPEAVAVFHTSGTTQQRSGKHYFRTLDFYRAAMLRSFAAYCLDRQLAATLGANTKTMQTPTKDVIPEESFYDSKQFFEMKQDDHESTVAQASSLHADQMSALRILRDGCASEHDYSSGMTFSSGSAKANKMRLYFLGPTAEHFPHSSLGYMFSGIRNEFGDEKSAVLFSPDGVDAEGFQRALAQASQEHAPVFILGTALALWECMEKFAPVGQKFHLPPGSRILDTGGYKSRQIEVRREEFQHRLSETFGVPQEYLLNEYGMTELSSQFYASRLPGLSNYASRFTPDALHSSPPWVRVVAVDPENLTVLPDGETGLLRIFDLANVDSVMAIQTEDLGRAWQDRIELIGRARGAELRGCSLLTEMISRNT